MPSSFRVSYDQSQQKLPITPFFVHLNANRKAKSVPRDGHPSANKWCEETWRQLLSVAYLAGDDQIGSWP